jgi:hypothetical protein
MGNSTQEGVLQTDGVHTFTIHEVAWGAEVKLGVSVAKENPHNYRIFTLHFAASLNVKVLQVIKSCSKLSGCACFVLLAGHLLGSLVNPEDGGYTFLRNIGKILPDNTVSHDKGQ